ncbi:LamG-like jellyroll fold domain-containing protein, partial [Sneathiella glossodoripedis]|uniref:LamG-like jellyroll fold domain-containing protein n=1 Tax=Sneathiella glossodoripedis TaxID=418853 RepID=UPI0005632E00
ATTTTPPTEEELLVQNAEALGADVVDLGRSADLFGMDNFTLSATFSLNSLNGGNQTLLWNHMQYGITVKDNDLQVALRGSDGNLDYINIKDVFSDTGWHDVQVVRNAAGNTLEIFVDGSNVHSQDATNFELTEPLYWNVTAGGTPWGDSFDGMLADVSVVRSAVEVDESASIYQRMYDMDANDVAKPLDVEMQETTGGSDANDVALLCRLPRKKIRLLKLNM